MPSHRPRTLRTALTSFLLLAAISLPAAAQQRKILIYTRNYTPDGKGYVHDNIATSVQAIREIAAANHLAADASDDPAVFTDDNLRQYAALVFANSNNQAFSTAAQREAFQHYIHAGGGFVGLHSASGSERDWPYFNAVLGGLFAAHPRLQTFTIHVADRTLSGLQQLPADFPWTDECYFIQHLNPDLHPILTTDRTQLQDLDKTKLVPADFPNPLPLAWFHHFDNGREFYLALGHRKEDYANPLFRSLLTSGILFATARP